MSNSETITLRLPEAMNTRFAGKSLGETLYEKSVTILLNGALGAGKTTFLQGFAEALGIQEPLTSPTYALEQRYRTSKDIEFLHLDLYRLKPAEAMQLVAATDDHTGIRCIEWAERLPEGAISDPTIGIHIEEDGTGRKLDVHFADERIPGDDLIEQWRKDVLLQPHIIAHCEAVTDAALRFADVLLSQGRIVRKDALRAAAKLHDLFRFVDFKAQAPANVVQTDAHTKRWEDIKHAYPDMHHEQVITTFLRDENFPVIASIVETHGLHNESGMQPKTTEQKILFYADKRVMIDKFVTLEERFDDFVVRYTDGKMTEKHRLWLAMTRKIEKDLFPEGAPF